jgi:hypothetical protein
VKEIQSSSNFDIEIQKAKMFYAISSSNTRYYWDFEAKYVYPGDILKNPSIMFYDERNNYLLYWNKVKFNWEFKTQEIKNNFETFFENFSSLSNILSVINYNLNTSQFEIIYNDINYNDLTISNNIIKLQIRREQIHSINYNNKEILKKYIPISDLNETLQLIQQ